MVIGGLQWIPDAFMKAVDGKEVLLIRAEESSAILLFNEPVQYEVHLLGRIRALDVMPILDEPLHFLLKEFKQFLVLYYGLSIGIAFQYLFLGLLLLCGLNAEERPILISGRQLPRMKMRYDLYRIYFRNFTMALSVQESKVYQVCFGVHTAQVDPVLHAKSLLDVHVEE